MKSMDVTVRELMESQQSRGGQTSEQLKMGKDGETTGASKDNDVH